MWRREWPTEYEYDGSRRRPRRCPRRGARGRPGEGPVAVLGGALAGAVSCCVTNPLDTLRVRLAASRDATGAAHKSIVGHLRILFAGGVADAVGKGLLINIMASSPCNAVYLATYRYLSKRLAEPLLWEPPSAASGGGAGGSSTTDSDDNFSSSSLCLSRRSSEGADAVRWRGY